MSEHTEKEVHDLISSFREGLELYSSNLTPAKISTITPPKDINPTDELSKLSKLIVAHTTKIGIAFRPPVAINAGYAQLKETSEVLSVILGIVSSFTIEEYGELYQNEIIDVVGTLISRFILLLDDLNNMDYDQNIKREDDKKKESDEIDGRLVSIGRIWDVCKTIDNLLKNGKLGFLKNKIKLSIALIEDGLDEFEEWLEDPQVLDDFDPFGFADQENDEEDDEEEEKEELKEVDHEVLQLAKKWFEKIKLLKLLLSSLIKSLPNDETTVKGIDIDNFNKEQEHLVAYIDDLIANFFMSVEITSLNQIINKISNESNLLINLVKSLNKNDEKKIKWLEFWQQKFDQ